MIYNSTQLDHSNPPKENEESTPYGTLLILEMLLKLGIYSSASMQAHQCKNLLCSELGQKHDLKLYRNYYEGIILKFDALMRYILFMNTSNFQCTSSFLSKVVRVQSGQDLFY